MIARSDEPRDIIRTAPDNNIAVLMELSLRRLSWHCPTYLCLILDLHCLEQPG
jgi:hypothetical protein